MSGVVCSMMSFAAVGLCCHEMNMQYAKSQPTDLEKVYTLIWNVPLYFCFLYCLVHKFVNHTHLLSINFYKLKESA
jgi:hypothetical protein